MGAGQTPPQRAMASAIVRAAPAALIEAEWAAGRPARSSENGRLTLRYHLSNDDIYNVQDSSSQIIRDEQGAKTTSALAATYTYDRRNSVVDPTAGFILSLNQEFAGVGGDVPTPRPWAPPGSTPASSTRSW